MLSLGRAARCGLSAHDIRPWPISGTVARRWNHDLSVQQSRNQPDKELLSFILPESPNNTELVTRRSARQDQIRAKKSSGKAKRLCHDPWAPNRAHDAPAIAAVRYDPSTPAEEYASMVLLQRHSLIPVGFLVGLAPVIVSGKADHPSTLVVQPNRVLHPRFAPRYKGQGIWLLCNKETVEAAVDASKRATPFVKALVAAYGSQPMVQRPALLPAQIQYQLALRLVQELEVLAEQLCSLAASQAPQTAGGPAVLFGLTPTETAGNMSKGKVDRNIIAILDTAGLSLDASAPPTRNSPTPASPGSDLRLLPLPDDDDRQIPHLVVRDIIPKELHYRCHAALQAITEHERTLAERKTARKSVNLALRTWKGEEKGGLGVRVFEALWRLRLWHGFGWDTQHVMGR